MTREEEIVEAAFQRANGDTDPFINNYIDTFHEGAKWADDNPKFPWNDVNYSLPENNQAVLAANKESLYIAHYNNHTHCWVSEETGAEVNPTHWMSKLTLPGDN